MANLKRLLSDSVVYGLSSIVGRFLNYLLVPVYTYHIAASSGGYGVVTELYAYVALLLVLLTFGMETTYFYFVGHRGVEARGGFATALWSVGAVSVLFVVAVMLFIHPIAGALGYSEHPEYIKTMACVVALDAFQSILFARLRYERRPWKFAALKLAFIVGTMTLTLLVFLVAPRWQHLPWMQWYDEAEQVGYIFYINLICTSLVTFGFVPELRTALPRYFDPKLLRPMLRYALPLLLFGVVGIMNQVADKMLYGFLVPGEEGKVQLGIYGACAKIAMIMAMITQAFRYAYEPFVFAGGRDADSKESQALVMRYFLIFTLLAFLAVVCYLDDVLKYFVQSDYWEGLRVVPIVMVAEILMGVYFNLSFWYKLIGRTWWGALMSAVGCFVLVCINVVFVPRYGYMACAWGGLAGYATCTVMSYFLGQKYAPVHYPVKAMAGYFVVALLLFGITRMVHQWVDQLALRLILNTLVLGAYMAIVVWKERSLVSPILNRIKTLRHHEK